MVEVSQTDDGILLQQRSVLSEDVVWPLPLHYHDHEGTPTQCLMKGKTKLLDVPVQKFNPGFQSFARFVYDDVMF